MTKKLFTFTHPHEVEVEKTETTKNESGEEIKITKKVKETIDKKFFLKKPTRSLYDEAELFYGVKLSEGIKAGLLTRALLNKRFTNDGGVLSETEKNKFSSLYIKLFDLNNEYELLCVKKETERTDEEKQKIEETLKSIIEIKKEVQEFEYSQITLFDQTAENRARTKTILWWVMFLSYEEGVKEEEIPFFGNGTYEERLIKYDNIEEKEDVFLSEVIKKFVYFISLWYVGRCSTQEEFESAVKGLKEGSD